MEEICFPCGRSEHPAEDDVISFLFSAMQMKRACPLLPDYARFEMEVWGNHDNHATCRAWKGFID